MYCSVSETIVSQKEEVERCLKDNEIKKPAQVLFEAAANHAKLDCI